ncbi:MAG: hypothetical protein GY830_08405 [Bacteroidetes bacterium]|nr:hypothetical protein [Bacteroidota bacterium]
MENFLINSNKSIKVFSFLILFNFACHRNNNKLSMQNIDNNIKENKAQKYEKQNILNYLKEPDEQKEPIYKEDNIKIIKDFIKYFKCEITNTLSAMKVLSTNMAQANHDNKTQKASKALSLAGHILQTTIIAIPLSKLLEGTAKGINYINNKKQIAGFNKIIQELAPTFTDIDNVANQLSNFIGSHYDYYLTKISNKKYAEILAKYFADILKSWLLKFEFSEDLPLYNQLENQIGKNKNTFINNIKTIKNQFKHEIAKPFESNEEKASKKILEFFNITEQWVQLKEIGKLSIWYIYSFHIKMISNYLKITIYSAI